MRDIAIRRFPVHVQSYDGLLADPEKVIRKTIEWIGDDQVSADEAIAAVKPENRTQKRPESDSVEPEFVEVFDELYNTVHEGKGLTREFIEKLNATNEKLIPRIREHQRLVNEDVAKRQQKRTPIEQEDLAALGLADKEPKS